uniref:Probable membrane transporter protein n=1 Tax=Geoglobus ahangari TaxID=113653 RepID=A0A7C4S7J4_9EURY
MQLLLTFLTAFIIAFFASPSGVSGAFLLLPFLVSVLGITDPSANATNFLYNVIAIPSGVYRYWKEKRMLWILALIMIIGYLPGIYVGSLMRTSFLLDPKTFKLFIGIVLMFLGLNLARTIRARYVKEMDEKVKTFKGVKGFVTLKEVSLKRVSFNFWEKEYSFNPFGIFAISLAIGIVGGAYGVGGGALAAPLILSIFKLPIYAIAGANLLGTFTSSVFGIISYSSLGYLPRLDIGLALGFGGLSGMYCGARIQKYLPEKLIRISLTILILLLSFRYITQFFIQL